MSPVVIEGTWEEIEVYKPQLSGHRLRVAIIDNELHDPGVRSVPHPLPAIGRPKQLQAMGAFKGKTGGSEAFVRHKQAEIDLEERHR